MIGYLKGTLLEKNLKEALVLCGHVGYRVSLSLADSSRLNPIGEEVAFFVHTHVREDAIELYGFLQSDNRHLFESLISVSGIGPKMGLALLSGMSSDTLISAIGSGDFLALTRIPGVGNKTAQRIVLELQDKITKTISFAPKSGETSSGARQILGDLRSAIANLGYKSVHVDKAVKAVESMATQGHPLEHLVKEALRHI